jgi:uncharacterized protein (DUF2252 family)
MTVVEAITEFNRGRDPERLALKLRAIRKNPFFFLRGTCHLFYQRLPRDPLLARAPATWLCGDLHVQNMGSYKGDNRLVYYDINDFDESALGPCTWDLVRLLASILVSAPTLGIGRRDAVALCRTCVDAYTATLRQGVARWIEAETAQGLIKDLLDSLATRRRRHLLDARTKHVGRTRRLRTDGRKALPASDEQRARITQFLAKFAARQPNPRFYRLLDIGRRIAGIGSLGIDRFVLLVEGKGSPDRNYLLDLKHALPSSLIPRLRTPQPRWPNEAVRITQVQTRMQAVPQALLHAETIDGAPYVLRDLQPSEDRIDLMASHRKPGILRSSIHGMGQLLAWDQLRSSGRQGSSIADELIAFGSDVRLRKGLIDLAVQCSASVEADWREYRRSELGLR